MPAPKRRLGVGWGSLKFPLHSLTRLLLPTLLFPPGLFFWSYLQPSSSPISLWRKSTLFPWIILIFEEYGITHYKLKWLPGPVTEWGSKRPPWIVINVTSTVTTLLDPPFWFYPKLERSQVENFPDSRENRLHNYPDSKAFGFKVSTLNSGVKISGDMTKRGGFYFGFLHLYVKGGINLILELCTK